MLIDPPPDPTPSDAISAHELPEFKATPARDFAARYPWAGWAFIVMGLGLAIGGVIRACW